MSTGQTFLALGAVVLFMVLAMNINRSSLTAVEQQVVDQDKKYAINYGQSLAEEVYSVPYNTLDDVYKNHNDVAEPDERKQMQTLTGETLYATINVSDDVTTLIQGVEGKIVTITVFDREQGQYQQQVQYKIAIPKGN